MIRWRADRRYVFGGLGIIESITYGGVSTFVDFQGFRRESAAGTRLLVGAISSPWCFTYVFHTVVVVVHSVNRSAD